MVTSPAWHRHLPDRPRLQPAGRRPARRLRSTAGLLILLAACGQKKEPPREDFHARFVENRWDVGEWRVEELVTGLARYVAGDDPVYPQDDPHVQALHEFLFLQRPDPMALRDLFLPHVSSEVTDQVMKRDLITWCVVTSWIRRIFVDQETPDKQKLYDAIAAAWIHAGWDRSYGDAHTLTAEQIVDFFGEPRFVACPESKAAIGKHSDALLGEWRRRVTDKGSSAFFGILLRHLGVDAVPLLLGEWEAMHEQERVDVCKRLAYEDRLPVVARRRLVDSLLDASLDVRDAALEALARHGAPVREIDTSARETDLQRALPPLRRWAETES